MKKVFSLLLTLVLVGTCSTFAFAKTGVNFKIKGNGTSIQKSLQTIAPKTVNPNYAQIVTQLGVIKTLVEGNNTIVKEIYTKNITTIKTINTIRKNKQTLSADQYTAVSGLLTTIDTTKQKIVPIKGMNAIAVAINTKNTDKINKLNLTDLTNVQTSLNQNTVNLKTISSTYDSVNSILTVLANTTPAAITIPVTTPAAIK